MLAAIILLGLLPLAAMPLFESSGADDDAQGSESEEATTETIDLTENNDGEPVEGAIFSFDATPGTSEISEFQEGQDMVTLDLSSVPGTIYFDEGSDSNGAIVSFSTSEEAATSIRFNGFQDVPTDDITLRLTDDESGEIVEMSLADAIQFQELIAADETAVDPTDPDLVDPILETDPIDEIADPTDPTDLDEDLATDPIDEVLDPVDPDAVGINPFASLLRDAMVSGPSENMPSVFGR